MTNQSNTEGIKQTQLEQAEQREPLFDFEEDDLNTPMVNNWDAERKLRFIAAQEQALVDVAKYEADALDWIRQRKLKIAQRIDYAKSQLDAFMKFTNQEKVIVQSGTVYYRNYTTRSWPTDEVVVAWAWSTQLGNALIRTVESPKKKEILEYIHKSGDAPEGFKEEKLTTLTIRKNT